jgi:hypothetical protein
MGRSCRIRRSRRRKRAFAIRDHQNPFVLSPEPANEPEPEPGFSGAGAGAGSFTG